MDEDLDLLKAVRLSALWAVKKRGPEYMLRHIFRWYSREFHIPLPEVDSIPLENVLTDYFECRYESMEDDDLDAEEERLRETYSERLAREAREAEAAEEDDEFFQDVKREAKISNAKVDAAKRSLEERIREEGEETIPVPVMGEKLPQVFQELAERADPRLRTVPADIKMEFVSQSELEEMEDWDVLGPPKRGDD